MPQTGGRDDYTVLPQVTWGLQFGSDIFASAVCSESIPAEVIIPVWSVSCQETAVVVPTMTLYSQNRQSFAIMSASDEIVLKANVYTERPVKVFRRMPPLTARSSGEFPCASIR